jgi:hypothetical protein
LPSGSTKTHSAKQKGHMARIVQMTLILMVNNALILLAVADGDFINIALYGGWAMIILVGIYLARGLEDYIDYRNDIYRQYYRRHK